MKLSESVEQVLSNESLVLDGFYARLFEQYPEFKDYFAESNLQTQTAMLTMALVSVKQYPEFRAPAQAYLQTIGTKHHDRGIARELYPKFIEVLVDTVAEFHGEQWTESLADQWTKALKLAAATMHDSYKE